jgi:hypothetical protein
MGLCSVCYVRLLEALLCISLIYVQNASNAYTEDLSVRLRRHVSRVFRFVWKLVKLSSGMNLRV